MRQERAIAFGPFRLEVPPGRLWRGDDLIPLRPRSLAMLRYLAAHPGRLVTKTEVQQHVWAGTHGIPNVLRVCAGDSGSPGRRSSGAAVSRNGWTAGLSVVGGRGPGSAPAATGGPPGGAPG
jgi:hypothetical protein